MRIGAIRANQFAGIDSQEQKKGQGLVFCLRFTKKMLKIAEKVHFLAAK